MSSSDAAEGPAANREPTRLDPELAERIAGQPDARLAVIVTARGAMDGLYAALPVEATVTHAYRLIGSLAIEAPGTAILALATHPDVAAIEAVRDVEAWSP